MSFVLSWSAHQQREDAVPGGDAGTWDVLLCSGLPKVSIH